MSQLPFCFKNVHQFEYTVKQPIGKTWNAETAYRKMITPKVSTMMGTVIDPINKKETFKHMQKKKMEDVATGTDKQGGRKGRQKNKKKT